MNRKMKLILLVLVCVALLAGCKCQHEWVAADCVTPKTCTLCQETEGAPLGHNWLDATCKEAKTCKVCGAVEGVAAGHSWVDASCVAPKHCENCDLTEGEVLDHTWLDATTEAPMTCSFCGATEGERIITDERFKTEACKALFGSWQFEQIMTGEEMDLGDYVDEVPFVAVLNFADDGHITMDMAFGDEEKFTADLQAGTVEVLYDQFEAMNMTREEADTAFMDTYGMSIEDYCVAMWAAVNWDTIFDMYEMEFVYYVEGDQIYVASDWDSSFAVSTYKIEGDMMTLTDSVLAGGTVLDMTRVK